ncbi:MAG: response regulator [Myxococcota bacterium]
MRILVVDDNRALAENLAEILDDAGHDTVVVEHPEAALAAAGKAPFDLMLLDVRLPGMDGVELFERLRKLAPDAHFLLMTAFTDAGRLQDAWRAGVQSILPKPVPLGHLLGFVDAVARGDRVALLVEDEEALASNLAEVLEDRWKVRQARTVAEARQEAAESPLKVALVDLRLPDGLGVELVAHLRARNVAVMVMTGMGRREAESLLGPAVPVVTKPFDAGAMVERLAEVG